MKTNDIVTVIVVLMCVVLLCVIIGICAIPGIQKECSLKNWLNQMEQETDTVPVYVTHKRRVNIDGNSFNVGDIVEEAIGTQSWDYKVVFADTRVWFVYMLRPSKGNTWTMNIASVDREGKDFQTHYCAEFVSVQNSQWSPMDIRCRSTYYSDEWCYYYNDKIVLTDKVTLFEYDLQTSTARQYSYASYQHPICEYDCDINNRNTITISTPYGDRIITSEDAAKISTSFATMLEIGDIDIWDQTPSLVYLFDSVQFDGNELYVVCRMHSFYGETYAVVFQYEHDTNELYYCFSQHTGGPIEENLYIVPTVSSLLDD